LIETKEINSYLLGKAFDLITNLDNETKESLNNKSLHEVNTYFQEIFPLIDLGKYNGNNATAKIFIEYCISVFIILSAPTESMEIHWLKFLSTYLLVKYPELNIYKSNYEHLQAIIHRIRIRVKLSKQFKELL